jgi:hypothetical protein
MQLPCSHCIPDRRKIDTQRHNKAKIKNENTFTKSADRVQATGSCIDIRGQEMYGMAAVGAHRSTDATWTVAIFDV